MIQSIEIIILQLIQQFYNLPMLVGAAVFGAPAAFLLIKQTSKQDNYMWGIGAGVLIVLLALHAALPDWVRGQIEG
ncbi:MAG: hypothetical protein KDD70_07530, partial [Bdellovibrionales bacterium]|nr:hypothetical protein [Bdellovibrionales bacterium]